MCLIVVGWQQHPDFPLVVAANRDEFYARPTADIARWADHRQIIAGRDLEAGGTWLGITDSGRFAAVTNVREPGLPKGACSRGALPRDYLAGQLGPEDYLASVRGDQYSGFNVLLADQKSLWYGSNRGGPPRRLSPGVYGLSNHLLDSPWPKLLTARQGFAEALSRLPDSRAFFDLLADDEIIPDHALPATGVPLEWERLLSAIFVRSETYGTRASTLLTVSAGQVIRLEERTFGPEGVPLQSSVMSTGV